MNGAQPNFTEQEWWRSLSDHVQKRITVQMSLSAETDRGAAIVGVSYLDTQLERLFQRVFVSSRSHGRQLLKGPGAPVGTYSSRIDMAFALALIGSQQQKHLHVFRKIRNLFAHSFEPLSFDENAIIVETKKLELPKVPPGLLSNASSRTRFEFAVTFEMSRLEGQIESALPLEFLPQGGYEFEAGSPEYRNWISRIQSIQAGKEPEPRTWYPDPRSEHRIHQPESQE
ncbi:MAG: hypothetical protein KF699_04165 [Phycisphaeraceae bacterium]|nr:hypothetical protein [Phycisphaeraceae bacterium]